MSLEPTFRRRRNILRRKPMGLSTEPLKAALSRLGSPQNRVPSVLIGGTNGKGSTAVMVESVARAAGLRTGLFHSPAPADHEHVHLDGRPVDRSLFIEHFLAADGAGDLSWFEAVTGSAFGIFAAQQVDLAIVEVGLGGRRDCTNTIDLPQVSAVVSVDRDHQDVLGSDLLSIAREKAGIFRPRRPAVIGPVAPDVESVLREEAERVGADLIASFPAAATDNTARLRFRETELDIELPLAGAHQIRNATVALSILEALEAGGLLHLSESDLRRGLSCCRWPGRLEWIQCSRPVLLDGAHNPAAVRTVVSYLQQGGHTPVDVLFGVFADKDVDSMLHELGPVVRRFVATATEHPRAMSPTQVAERRQRIGGNDADAIGPWNEALNDLLKQDADRPLLVVGSLDLVARVRQALSPHSSNGSI